MEELSHTEERKKKIKAERRGKKRLNTENTEFGRGEHGEESGGEYGGEYDRECSGEFG
jgi:hypothetical protein